jgi:hypothetical protein
MASLELIDHTQDLECWRLPQQQHGARQHAAARQPELPALSPADQPEPQVVELSAE